MMDMSFLESVWTFTLSSHASGHTAPPPPHTQPLSKSGLSSLSQPPSTIPPPLARPVDPGKPNLVQSIAWDGRTGTPRTPL